MWIGRGRGRGVNGEGEAVWELRRRIDHQQWPGLPPLPRNASRRLLLLLASAAAAAAAAWQMAGGPRSRSSHSKQRLLPNSP